MANARTNQDDRNWWNPGHYISKQSKEVHASMTISKTKTGYVVKSEKTGKPLSKPNLSKAGAAKRIAQVEYFKAHPKGGSRGR